MKYRKRPRTAKYPSQNDKQPSRRFAQLKDAPQSAGPRSQERCLQEHCPKVLTSPEGKICLCLARGRAGGRPSTSRVSGGITMQWRMLVICSTENRKVIESAILEWSLEVCWCLTLQQARRGLRRGNHALVLCEAELPDGTYQDVMALLKHKLVQVRAIVMADTYSEDSYCQAIELGAFDVISAPYRRTDVQWIIMQAVQNRPVRAGAEKKGGQASHHFLALV